VLGVAQRGTNPRTDDVRFRRDGCALTVLEAAFCLVRRAVVPWESHTRSVCHPGMGMLSETTCSGGLTLSTHFVLHDPVRWRASSDQNPILGPASPYRSDHNWQYPQGSSYNGIVKSLLLTNQIEVEQSNLPGSLKLPGRLSSHYLVPLLDCSRALLDPMQDGTTALTFRLVLAHPLDYPSGLRIAVVSSCAGRQASIRQ
jgi:hypothetical protein